MSPPDIQTKSKEWLWKRTFSCSTGLTFCIEDDRESRRELVRGRDKHRGGESHKCSDVLGRCCFFSPAGIAGYGSGPACIKYMCMGLTGYQTNKQTRL